MASRTITLTTCDVDGEEEGAENFSFTVDQTSYELDLCTDHAAEFHQAFAAYREVARHVGGRPRARRTLTAVRRAPSSAASTMRAWAKENGYNLSDRGRIPADVMAAYEAR